MFCRIFRVKPYLLYLKYSGGKNQQAGLPTPSALLCHVRLTGLCSWVFLKVCQRQTTSMDFCV